MITEETANEIYESFKRCRQKNPGDPYWRGAMSAMQTVLGKDRLVHEPHC